MSDIHASVACICEMKDEWKRVGASSARPVVPDATQPQDSVVAAMSLTMGPRLSRGQRCSYSVQGLCIGRVMSGEVDG